MSKPVVMDSPSPQIFTLRSVVTAEVFLRGNKPFGWKPTSRTDRNFLQDVFRLPG